MTSKDYFKGKMVAMIGLGPHGEMVEDAKFLIKMGAILSIYDLRSEARLKNHLVYLRSIGLANYVCGAIPVEDLSDMKIIVLSHEYPKESAFLQNIKDKDIQIEYPEALFLRLAPPVTIVGVIGACGKSTVISMLRPMLEEVFDTETKSSKKRNTKNSLSSYHSGYEQNLFVLDPESDEGTLSALKKVKNNDVVLIRITALTYALLRDMNISPQVAVYTSMPSRYTYFESPFEILNAQTYNNFIVASDQIIDATRHYRFQPKVKMLRTKDSIIPPEWGFIASGYDLNNAALAVQVAKLFKVPDEVIQHSLALRKPLKNHVEFVKKIKHVEYYNDSASTVPDATISALYSLATGRNIVLIAGGAYSGADYRELRNVVVNFAHTIVLLPGSGTARERKTFEQLENTKVISAPTLEEAVRLAQDAAKPNDRVLFSPGFEAVGIDASRKERGERYVRAVRSL